MCERLLVREKQTPQEHLADGLGVLLDSRRIAIEVELTVKSKRRVRAPSSTS